MRPLGCPSVARLGDGPRRCSYDGITLCEVCDQIHAQLCDRRVIELLPRLPRNPPPADIRRAPARNLYATAPRKCPSPNWTAAAAAIVVPYLPAMPILLPGERAGTSERPVLPYLSALEALDGNFPGLAQRRGRGPWSSQAEINDLADHGKPRRPAGLLPDKALLPSAMYGPALWLLLGLDPSTSARTRRTFVIEPELV